MKAIMLLSGGLDSTLAAKITQDLGIELIALHTTSPFCQCNHKSSSGCFHGALSVAKQLGVRMRNIDVSQDKLAMVQRPKHGYGSNLNPCIDCRILLFKKAKELMAEEGAEFVITGEVIGQRPMSQKRRTMQLIEQESGLEGLVVRPLSAKVMDPTLPEQRGWIDREKLFAMNGRGRHDQMSLAKELGINDYPCPAGGCLLTDPGFCRRLKDLMRYGELSLSEVNLLKVGRHFRLSPQAKLVVGRNEEENNRIISLAVAGNHIVTPSDDTAGPTALCRGAFTQDLVQRSRSIVAYYCDRPEGQEAADCVVYRAPDGERRVSSAAVLSPGEIASLRI